MLKTINKPMKNQISLSTEEAETILLFNQADLKQGFFRFTTSRAVDFKRLIRRVGCEENLQELKLERVGSTIMTWICKVPICYFSKNTFGIGKKRKGNPNPNINLFRKKKQ